MSGYIGNIPVPQATQTRQSFTATASQTTFNTAGYTAGFIDVFLNGIKLVDGTDYTATNGSDVVLTTGAAVSDVLDVVMYAPFDVVNTSLTDATINNTLTLKNATEEDTDGGRESTIIFKGEQSGGEISTLAEIEASHDGTADDEKGDLIFRTNDGADGSTPTERMRIASDGRTTIINTTAPTLSTDTHAGEALFLKSGGADGDGNVQAVLAFGKADGSTNRSGAAIGSVQMDTDIDKVGLAFYTSDSAASSQTMDERMRIDKDGNVLVGTTSAISVTSGTDDGLTLYSSGRTDISRSNGQPLNLRLQGSDGKILGFYKNTTAVGSIGNASANSIYINGNGSASANLGFGGSSLIYPTVDNVADVGASGNRFDDIYATNGTILTSDQNEKQQIASLTDAEITAAKAISKLFKTFKWNDSVTEKGDAARTHTGVIAQEVEQAMTDAGLNAGDYAFFISTTWWEADETYTDDDGVEQTRTNTYDTAEEAPEGATERNRKGIRYPQLLSFIGAATEQRLASIESRLDALENPA